MPLLMDFNNQPPLFEWFMTREAKQMKNNIYRRKKKLWTMDLWKMYKKYEKLLAFCWFYGLKFNGKFFFMKTHTYIHTKHFPWIYPYIFNNCYSYNFLMILCFSTTYGNLMLCVCVWLDEVYMILFYLTIQLKIISLIRLAIF